MYAGHKAEALHRRIETRMREEPLDGRACPIVRDIQPHKPITRMSPRRSIEVAVQAEESRLR